ncbi:hypothetical protein J2W15_000720 [Pseudarthrobacter sulfonivorans]|nr:hypothetical protein [Pseudarthrobacter sulfonivorans]
MAPTCVIALGRHFGYAHGDCSTVAPVTPSPHALRPAADWIPVRSGISDRTAAVLLAFTPRVR